MCVCVCVREREREMDIKKDSKVTQVTGKNQQAEKTGQEMYYTAKLV